MSSPVESTISAYSSKQVDVKVLPEKNLGPEAVSTERGLFRRANARAFDNDSLEEHYVPVVNHEGAHRYYPDFEWTPQEEKRVVRRVGPALTSPFLPQLTLGRPDRLAHLLLGVLDVLRLAA